MEWIVIQWWGSVTPDRKPKDACVLDARYNQPDSYYLFNHVDIFIEYRDMSQDPNFLDEKIGGRIIRIKVAPRSIKHASRNAMKCDPNAPAQAIGANDKDVNGVWARVKQC